MPTVVRIDEPSRLWQITAFCLVGLLSFCIYNGLLYFLTEHVGWWHIASATVGFVSNTLMCFPLHKYVTYRNMKTTDTKQQMREFVSVRAKLFLANAAVLYVFVDHFHLWYVEVQAVFLIFFGALSFVLYGRIFKKRPLTA